MKSNIKRRVQAQRKFAQGAFIPPSIVVSIKNDVPTPSRPDHQNIIQSNLSAKSLLDIVSLQSVHTHSDPVVLIERLNPSTELPPPPVNGQSEDHKSPPPPKPRQAQSPVASTPSTPSTPAPIKRAFRLKKKTNLAQKTMVTANRLRPGDKKLQSIKPRPQRNEVVSMRLKRALARTVSTSDWEDDRPLKYFKTLARNKVQPTEKRVTRASGKQIKKKKPARSVACSGSPAPSTRLSASSASSAGLSTAPSPGNLESPGRSPGNLSSSSPSPGRITTRSAKKINVSPAEKDRTPKKTAESPVASTSKEPDSLPKFKQPAIPARFTKQRKRAISRENNTAAETANRPMSPVRKLPKYQHYDSCNIEQWLSGGSHAPRTRPACPAEALRTVGAVVDAAPELIARRCKQCQACNRVNTVHQLSGLLHKGRRPNDKSSDVYEFDADDEASASAPPFLYVHRKRRTRAQDKNKGRKTQQDKDQEVDNNASSDDEERVYLDLQKESPHIIEMTSVRVPNCKKKMMKARLVSRSHAHPTGDISLVEHEKLLDQLLQTLIVKETDPDDSDVMSTVNNDISALCWDETTPKTQKNKETGKTAQLVEAPTFYPTPAEFADPVGYVEKIAPLVAKFGMCKVRLPDSFRPECVLNDDLKFNVVNHYIARMFSRWGPATREICALRAYLATQNIHFNRVPLLDSIEVNMPKLYAVVQQLGGLEQVIDKKLWGRVAEEMGINKGPNTEKILDNFYVKYLLPFDTASNQERAAIMNSVEREWIRKQRKLVEWANNPLHLQKKVLGESDSSDEEPTNDWVASKALYEAEDCVVAGRPMNLSGFKKVATNAMSAYMRKEAPTVQEVESVYWRHMLIGTEHICVNGASIDTYTAKYGFTKDAKHPWNLKNLTLNDNNLLRSINNVLGVTIPTLHLGMVFSTCCWHRDPHGLPWTEYMHSGPPKIWYGIPEEQSANFRKAVESLCPTSAQNKYIWLSSDITMIPPNLLLQHDVSLSQTVQNPGEFIIVFPQSYSCSISTGFTVSESVYFAPHSWVTSVHQIFQELRSSCEPTAFALEHLLIALAKDPRSTFKILHTVHSSLKTIVDEELRLRKKLANWGLQMVVKSPPARRTGSVYNVQDESECKICRCTLYLSKVVGLLGKKIHFCPMHAIRMLETHKYSEGELAKTEVVLYYSEKQLEEIMTNLKRRLLH